MKKFVIGVIPDGTRTHQRRHPEMNLVEAYQRGARVGIRVVKEGLRLGATDMVFYVLSGYDWKNRNCKQVRAILAGVKEFFLLLRKFPVMVQCYGDLQPVEINRLARLAPVRRPAAMKIHVLLNYCWAWDDSSDPRGTAKIPPLDLVFRTSGAHRLSEFCLSRIGYAEIEFTNTLWPALRMIQFCRAIGKCLEVIRKRKRRGGRGA